MERSLAVHRALWGERGISFPTGGAGAIGAGFERRLLAEPEVAAYLTQRLGSRARSERLARGLPERTEGNPLFLVTVVDELVRQAPAGWELGEGLEAAMVGVPESLRQLIDRRLAKLSREEQQNLEAAGVVGLEFTAAAAAAGVEQVMEKVIMRRSCISSAARRVRHTAARKPPWHSVASRGSPTT